MYNPNVFIVDIFFVYGKFVCKYLQKSLFFCFCFFGRMKIH